MKRLFLRWLLIGWWAVPLLVLIFMLAVILDGGGWIDLEGNHQEDPELAAIAEWCLDHLISFFR